MNSRFGTLPPGQMYSARLVASDDEAARLAAMRAKVRVSREQAQDKSALTVPSAAPRDHIDLS